jgi:hypothetical protein
MNRYSASALCGVAAIMIVSPALTLRGQRAGDATPEPKTWTVAEDHQHMMAQLGIRRLRPGPSGNESAPNHANYDEATANPFPDLPEVLTLENGRGSRPRTSGGKSAGRRSSKTSNAKCLDVFPALCQRSPGRSPIPSGGCLAHIARSENSWWVTLTTRHMMP